MSFPLLGFFSYTPDGGPPLLSEHPGDVCRSTSTDLGSPAHSRCRSNPNNTLLGILTYSSPFHRPHLDPGSLDPFSVCATPSSQSPVSHSANFSFTRSCHNGFFSLGSRDFHSHFCPVTRLCYPFPVPHPSRPNPGSRHLPVSSGTALVPCRPDLLALRRGRSETFILRLTRSFGPKIAGTHRSLSLVPFTNSRGPTRSVPP